MKKRLLSLLLIAVMFTPIITACNLLPTSASASKVYAKYQQVVSKYYNADYLNPEITDNQGNSLIYKNYFNANGRFVISYKGGDVQTAVIDPTSPFYVLGNEYAMLLEASMGFFYEYGDLLMLGDDKWDEDQTAHMYDTLLELEKILKEFDETKSALENLSSIDYAGLITQNALDNFIAQYNRLIKKTIDFNKYYEKAYYENLNPKVEYEELTSLPEGDLKRTVYTSRLHLAEIVYHYNIKYKNGIVVDDDEYDELIENLTTLNATVVEREGPVDPSWEVDPALLGEEMYTKAILDYKAVRQKEEDMLIQKKYLIQAVGAIDDLGNNTEDNRTKIYYEDSISTFYQTFNSYSIFVNNFLDYLDIEPEEPVEE